MRAVGPFVFAAAGVLLTVALFFGGGAQDERLFWIGMGLLLVLLAGAVAVFGGLAPRPSLDRAGLAFFGFLAAFVVWNGLTVWWSIVPDRSWAYFNRGLVYLGFALLGLLAGALLTRSGARDAAPLPVAMLFAAVAGWALLGKVFPGLFEDGGRIARLRNPVGYWNGLALLLALALPLFLYIATRRRVLGALGVYLATIALLLTYSRAGVAAAVAAVGLWLVLGFGRRESLRALAASVPVALLVAGIGLALPGIARDLQPESVRTRDGAFFALALVLGSLLTCWVARRDLQRLELRLLAGAAALLVAAGIGGLAAKGSFLQEFRDPQVTQTSGRLTSTSSNNRWTWWKESWRIFEAEPAGGKGAGSFQVARRPIRTTALVAVEPHNAALQFLAETGIVGFLLGAGAAAAAIAIAASAARRNAAKAALAVTVPVYLLHTLVDIDWDFVAVSAPVFLFAGLLAGSVGESREPRRRPFVALGAAVLVMGAGYSLTAPWLADRDVETAYEAIGRGQARAAVSAAKSAQSFNPLAVEPLWAWASGELLRGDEREALSLYLRAAELQPENSSTWYALGAFRFDVLDDPCTAYDDLNRAYTLDRYGPAGIKGGLLDRARAIRNSGRCS